MSSPLTETSFLRGGATVRIVGATLLVCGALAGLLAVGCHGIRREVPARDASRLYPPPPQTPQVVALGTLRGAAPPTKAQVDLALFLFGVEPPPPLTIANPTDLVVRDEQLLICDNTLSKVFQWDAVSNEVSEARFKPPLEHPFAIDIAPNGDRLVCDGREVARTDAAGEVLRRYALDSQAFKPAGVLAVGEQVWVSNSAAHRIEVFDAQTGEHRRSIGARGVGRGQFDFPRGLARTPDGNVCVVDVLNNRVQVLDGQGNWLRTVGGPGDRPGSFGRPKAVAVGPDGTVFVTDAFSQRVHAFTSEGQPLLAFGEPGSGIGELTLPNGIAVSTAAPRTQHKLPPDLSAAYYVLVAEQLRQPGVRVYAWLGDYDAGANAASPSDDAVARQPDAPEPSVGPHWDAQSCTSCHDEDEDRLLPIATDEVNDLCLACHDGHQSAAWAHPVDRPATGPGLHVPAEWPLADQRLACLTCHDVKRHCSVEVKRTATDLKLLRAYDPRRAANFCMVCHTESDSWYGSPHGQLNAKGQVNRQACLFCHAERPTIPADGVRRGEAKLREPGGSCLNCHSRHWDYFSPGHVGRAVPPRIGARLAANELGASTSRTGRGLQRLPLADKRVACYTCHNPHQAALFPPGSELAMRAASRVDAGFYLRVDRPELCQRCHEK